MSLYYAYTCDVCDAKDEAWPTDGYLSTNIPKGWRSIDGRHICSYPCLAKYATEPDDYPAQKRNPDPVSERMRKHIRDELTRGDRKKRRV